MALYQNKISHIDIFLNSLLKAEVALYVDKNGKRQNI